MLILLIETIKDNQVDIAPFPLGLTTTLFSLKQLFPNQAKPRGGHSFSHSTLSGRGVFMWSTERRVVFYWPAEREALNTNKFYLKLGNKTVNSTDILNTWQLRVTSTLCKIGIEELKNSSTLTPSLVPPIGHCTTHETRHQFHFVVISSFCRRCHGSNPFWPR